MAIRATTRKKSSKPVWQRPAPAKGKHTRMSPKKKAHAKARAKRAGRRYPNLVDNIREAHAKG